VSHKIRRQINALRPDHGAPHLIQLNDPVAAAERIVAFARPGNAEIPVSPAD
jgi:hypothetical protein